MALYNIPQSDMVSCMTYSVRLAIFPPWKAPIPYETLNEEFATVEAAFAAAKRILLPTLERELAELTPQLQPRIEQAVIAVAVPPVEVHGFVIYDSTGGEVGNWTSLDEALERFAAD